MALTAALVSLVWTGAASMDVAPPPVAELNVTSYLGRWFQVYASASVQWTFEVGGKCVTADYGKVAGRSDVVSVLNTVRLLGSLPIKVHGYAIANPKQAGELDVVLGPTADPSKARNFTSTNYLVFGLGPVREGLYDYALVSDPEQRTLVRTSESNPRLHRGGDPVHNPAHPAQRGRTCSTLVTAVRARTRRAAIRRPVRSYGLGPAQESGLYDLHEPAAQELAGRLQVRAHLTIPSFAFDSRQRSVVRACVMVESHPALGRLQSQRRGVGGVTQRARGVPQGLVTLCPIHREPSHEP
jgi:lipocalin